MATKSERIRQGVGAAGRRHDQDGREEHEPPPAHDVPREPHRARGVGAGAARGAVAEHHRRRLVVLDRDDDALEGFA